MEKWDDFGDTNVGNGLNRGFKWLHADGSEFHTIPVRTQAYTSDGSRGPCTW